MDLHDFESSAAFTQGELRLYDGGTLVFSALIDWGAGNDGDEESHFIGVVAQGAGSFFDQAMFVVGDDTAGGGIHEHWAADRFTFGAASAAVPEPSTVLLMGIGAALLFGAARRRRSSRR